MSLSGSGTTGAITVGPNTFVERNGLPATLADIRVNDHITAAVNGITRSGPGLQLLVDGA